MERNWKTRQRVKNWGAFCLGLLVAWGIAEVFLKFYHPFTFRVKGDRIILSANLKMIINNDRIPSLDRQIVHTKNSLGFRGQELPKNQNAYFKIIAIGGSTTESFYVSDNKTWPDILAQKLQHRFGNIWLNNAGFDGHSTFGHIILLQDYIVKMQPEMVLFLIGVNDINREDLRSYDRAILRSSSKPQSLPGILASYSECANILLNIYRSYKARNKALGHGYLDVETAEQVFISEAQREQIFKKKTASLTSYKKRVEVLIELSRNHGITPVLITQPTLYGCCPDPATKIDLSLIKVDDELNGCLAWEIMEAYNHVTRTVGREKDVFIIDLAQKLSHNSRFFYDTLHFNNKGSEVVASILYNEISPYLATLW